MLLTSFKDEYQRLPANGEGCAQAHQAKFRDEEEEQAIKKACLLSSRKERTIGEQARYRANHSSSTPGSDPEGNRIRGKRREHILRTFHSFHNILVQPILEKSSNKTQ